MGTSSGWDHRQPPAPGHTRPPVDQSGEPVGYNLSDLPMYEQPPPQQLQPYRAAPRSQADQGFRISLVGLLTSVFLTHSADRRGGSGDQRNRPSSIPAWR